MKVVTVRHEDNSIDLTITVSWEKVSETHETVVRDFIAKTEVKGFRKGKAPRKIVEKNLNTSEVYEEVLKRLLPKIYSEAIQTEHIKPIVSPKIELTKAKEKEDWVIVAHTCEMPAIDLGDFKKSLAESKSNQSKKIWVPGQEPEKTTPDKSGKPKPTLDELLSVIYSSVSIKIPSLLLEQETNRLLSDLIDQTRKLGLTVEQYLASTGRNTESLKKEYEEQAKKTITLEFALEKIADTEGILVSDDEIDQAISKAKTDAEKKVLESQRYYMATILRRQKTLDFLAMI